MKINLTSDEIAYIVRLMELNYADRREDFQSTLDIGAHNPQYDSLTNKLMQVDYKTFTSTVKEVSKEVSSFKENIFKDKVLFLGAGYHSSIRIAQLHKRLQYAVYELGGEQQNGGMGTEYDEQSGKEAAHGIKEALRDIIAAFGLTAKDL